MLSYQYVYISPWILVFYFYLYFWSGKHEARFLNFAPKCTPVDGILNEIKSRGAIVQLRVYWVRRKFLWLGFKVKAKRFVIFVLNKRSMRLFWGNGEYQIQNLFQVGLIHMYSWIHIGLLMRVIAKTLHLQLILSLIVCITGLKPKNSLLHLW